MNIHLKESNLFSMKVLGSLSSYLSSNGKRVLEISAVKSCSVRCKYCPQDLLIQSVEKADTPKYLTPELFNRVLSNAANHFNEIHWTGYSEPCLNKYLIDLIKIAHGKGYSQNISTTLVGYPNIIDYVGKSSYFDLKTLHLPDAEGLMTQGALTVNQQYLDTLTQFLDNHLYSSPRASRIKVVCFGVNMHPQVKSILSNTKYSSIIDSPGMIQQFHSRAGSLYNYKHFASLARLFNFMPTSEKSSQGRDHLNLLSSIISIVLPSFHYCAYRRLDQPVLLPSGELNICCMDYSLSCKYGNLSEDTITNINAGWKSNYLNDFADGKLSACSRCEYYTKFSPLDIIKRKLRQILKW